MERHLSTENLVANENAEVLEIIAVASDEHDLRALALLLVHLQGQGLELRPDHPQQGLGVGELHRDQVELDQVLPVPQLEPGIEHCK